MRFSNECTENRVCNGYNNHVNETKEFDANLYLIKRQASNQFVYMLPYFKE